MDTEIKEPKETKTCPDCGQEGIKNMGVHRRYCKARKDTPESKQVERPKTQIEPYQLIVSDVQSASFDNDLVAWFVIDNKGTKISKQMHHIGLVHDERGIIPAVLVLASDGSLIPPYLISGFLGLFSEYYQFPEAEQSNEEVPQRELQNELSEPVIAPQSEEKQDRVITPPEIHASQPEKKPFFASIFGKKEKKEKLPEISNSELASQILNVSKAT